MWLNITLKTLRLTGARPPSLALVKPLSTKVIWKISWNKSRLAALNLACLLSSLSATIGKYLPITFLGLIPTSFFETSTVLGNCSFIISNICSTNFLSLGLRAFSIAFISSRVNLLPFISR